MVLSSSWRAVIGVMLIFAFGCVAGSVTTSLIYQRNRMEFLRHGPEMAFERGLTKKLALRPDQTQAIHQIFVDNFAQRRAYQRQIQPQIQRVNVETFHQIRILLNPEQQLQFDRNVFEFRHRLQQAQLAHNHENPGMPPDLFPPGPLGGSPLVPGPDRSPEMPPSDVLHGMPPPPAESPGSSNSTTIVVPPVPTPDR